MIFAKRGAGRPSREETAELEDHILDCARRAFCRRGFAGTSMDDIAEECAVTKHTVYRRHPNKAALLSAVIERDLARLRGTVEETCCREPLESLRLAAWRCFDFSVQPETVAFFSFLEAEATYSDDVRQRFKRWHNQAIAPLIDAVNRAQQASALPPGDPIHVGETLLDFIDGPCRRLQLGRDDVYHGRTPANFFDERWALFLDWVGKRASET